MEMLVIRYVSILNLFAFKSGYSTWLFTWNVKDMTCKTMTLSTIFIYRSAMVFMDTNSQWYSVRAYANEVAGDMSEVSESGYLLAGGTFSICKWWCRCNMIQIDGQCIRNSALLGYITMLIHMIASGMQTVYSHTIGTNDSCESSLDVINW